MRIIHRSLPAVLVAALLPATLAAQEPSPSPSPEPLPAHSEYVEVTATRIPESPDEVPAALTVITGEDLRERGATDLRSALAIAAGVDVAPGNDFGGPAGSVPEFWGLKEFDAFLLVVDGVPWGGAFNPALSTLSLYDVERIEVLRGAAPVMYGATSFVGVIHVIHRSAGAPGGVVSASGGNYGSGSGVVSAPLPRWAGFASTLTADFGREGYRDDRTSWKKGHLLWRNSRSAGAGTLRFDVDGTWLDQQPGSPHPREGGALSSQVPLDANHNPDGAFLNDRRLAVTVGYERPVAAAKWSSLVSFTRGKQDAFHGFLTEVSENDPNANGFRETIHTSDLYVDTHLEWTRPSHLKIVAGLDYLYGKGKAQGGDFDYLVDLAGLHPPASADLPPAADIHIEDTRKFAGLYGFVEWDPAEDWRLELGGRLNVTDESRSASTLDFESNDLEAGADSRSTTRLSGTAALSRTVWKRGSDVVRLFAGYRNAFKPAAIDFGLDSSAEILKPETAQSYELGFKSELAGGALGLELSSFLMDFDNLVVSQAVEGLPVLANAGGERFKGIEASLSWKLERGWALRAAYSYHDTRFRDYVTEFDGVPTQLAGKRLEMSPHGLGALALLYAPAHGVFGSLELNVVGSRFLNKRNTALADGYVTVAAGLGYRSGRWELRASGRNLGDERPAVSESELGDSQYYRLPARRVDLTASYRF